MAWARRKKTTKTTVEKAKPAKAKIAKDFTFHTVTSEELLPDGAHLVSINIPGRPATKKTHQQIIYVKGQEIGRAHV